LYSALVVFISVLIGWPASELANEYAGTGVEMSFMTRTVLALGKARWIAVPALLAFTFGGPLAIGRYSKKPMQSMRLLKITIGLMAAFIVVALFFAIFSSS